MKALDFLVDRRRLILTLAALLSLSGAVAWVTMTRQEDPQIPDYWGQILVPWPGADAETVERLVIEPIEDALVEVNDVAHIDATAHAELAEIVVELDEATRDIDGAWDDVRDALARARRELPAEALEPRLQDDLTTEQESVVLSVTGSADPLALRRAARDLRDALLTVPEVARVYLPADPGEQITVRLDDAAARRLGLGSGQVAAQLGARNRVVPGGSLALGERTLRLRPLSDFQSLDEIAATPLALPGGGAVPLSEVARVTLGPTEPAAARMRHDGEMAVGLGVVPKRTANVVTFGEAVRRAVERARPGLEPLVVREVAFQPGRVSARLSQLGWSLLQSMAVVAGVVILGMGLRLGLIVTAAVPLIGMAALAVYAQGGGVLHQISIAALVLSLGMLVDNAICVAENVQTRIDRGVPGRRAAREAVRELAAPLAGATGTTLAAFVPMLASQGVTAAFTRALPVVIMLTLTVSYVYALFVTPTLAAFALRPGASRVTRHTDRLAGRLSRLALGRTRLVLAIAAALVALSFGAGRFVRMQFFPSSDRNQVVVDLKLPEGAHLDATDAATRRLERALLARDDVTGVAGFMGRSAPHFYYNLPRVPWSPHFAQVVVDTRRLRDVEPVVAWTRDWAARELPGVEVVARRLEQGPPVGAPVEVRLSGPDLADLHVAALAVARVLRDTPGAADVRHDLGPGEPTLRFVIDDAAAARFGVSRADAAAALYGRTRGLPAGDLRSGEDPVPVVVRSSEGERLPVAGLETVSVTGAAGSVPLAQVARLETDWRPAAINRHDRQRVVLVSSQLTGGTTYSDVLRAAQPRLARLDLPAGVTLSYAGEAEGSGEANSSLLRAMPLGLLLLFGVLLAEFNSFRRLGIIMTTVPLAAAGVIPGLLIGNQPFGFTSLLGVIALVGIVVNNAILLLEVIDARRREGAALDDALVDGVAQRIRPILLTAGTTVCGMLPLAFSPSTLWPPLAWAMISGLLASTMLTLVVVPALYRAVFARQERRRLAAAVAAPLATALLLALLAPARAGAQVPDSLTLADALARGRERPAAGAALERSRAAGAAATAEKRAAFLPVVGASAQVSRRDRDLALVTPIGNFNFGAASARAAGVQVVQPLLDPGRQVYAARAAGAEARAARASSRRALDELATEAGAAYLDALAVAAAQGATRAYVDALAARLAETAARVAEGRQLEADSLKIRLALDAARQELRELDAARAVALAALARAVGDTCAVAPAPAPDWTAAVAPPAAAAVAAALASRPDLAALAAAAAALDSRGDAVVAEWIPRLEARGTWSWTDGSPYDQESWAEGALAVTWSPFDAGTRGARAGAWRAQARAAAAELTEARRGVAIEVKQALAAVANARSAVGVATTGVAQAAEALRVERERHAAGRATTNDLLAAEASLREQETRLEIARLDVVRAWLALWLAGGVAELPRG